MSLHKNDGDCEYCTKVMDRYPGFDEYLRSWFKGLQAKFPEAHTSCAGRGRMDQEAAFIRRASKAHFGQSAHNFNMAMDIFKAAQSVEEMYDARWFETVVEPLLTSTLEWYGRPHSPFFELPHIEVSGWKALKDAGKISAVEK